MELRFARTPTITNITGVYSNLYKIVSDDIWKVVVAPLTFFDSNLHR